MRHHRGAFSFSPSTRCGRDSYQFWECLIIGNLGYGLLIFKGPKVNVIVRRQANRFAPIHSTAATNRDDGVMPTGTKPRPTSPNFIITRIRGYIKKQS